MISLEEIKSFLQSPLALLTLGLGIFCPALYEHQQQKDRLHKAQKTYENIQKQLKSEEEDIVFLSTHQQRLQFLIQKGWLIPKSRLRGGTEINRWATELNELQFKIEPEMITENERGYIFNVSKISIEAGALLDTSLYDFVEKISENFPGILVLRKLSIDRNAQITEINLQTTLQNKQLSLVRSELIFEWFAMGGPRKEKDRNF